MSSFVVRDRRCFCATKLPVSQRNRLRLVRPNEMPPQPQCARRIVRASLGNACYAHNDIPDSRQRGRCRMKAIVVTDQAAGTAGMKLVERPEPQGEALPASRARTTAMSLFRFMRRDSPGMSCRGPRPGSIASAVPDAVDPRPRAGRSGHRPQLWNDGAVGGTAGVRPQDWTRDGTLAEYVAVEARTSRRCRATLTLRRVRPS